MCCPGSLFCPAYRGAKVAHKAAKWATADNDISFCQLYVNLFSMRQPIKPPAFVVHIFSLHIPSSLYYIKTPFTDKYTTKICILRYLSAFNEIYCCRIELLFETIARFQQAYNKTRLCLDRTKPQRKV